VNFNKTIMAAVVIFGFVVPAFAQDCDRLANFSYDGVDVDIGSTARIEATTAPGVGSLPAHCRVDGVLDERLGVNDVTYGIRFALALPDNWNGRFLFQGGGGLNGSVGNPVGNSAAGETPALARGFAVVSTDTGHQGSGFDGSFMEDQQAALDFFLRG
jgi:feruloyl esterase